MQCYTFPTYISTHPHISKSRVPFTRTIDETLIFMTCPIRIRSQTPRH